MLNAIVVGNAVATTKDSSLDSCRLLLCQVLDAAGAPSKTPIVAVDKIGAGVGQKVVVSTDGIGAREMLGLESAPVRMWVQCLIDEPKEI